MVRFLLDLEEWWILYFKEGLIYNVMWFIRYFKSMNLFGNIGILVFSLFCVVILVYGYGWYKIEDKEKEI